MATATPARVDTDSPQGLVVLASLIGIMSGIGLLIAGLVLIVAASKDTASLNSVSVKLGVAWSAGFFILGIIASVALVRFEPWARRFCIGAGYIVGFWGSLFLADIAISAITSAKDRGVAEVIGIAVTAGITVLGFTSSLYLLRREVAVRFGVLAGNDPRPIAVWTVGWLLLAGCLTTIPGWIQSSPSTLFGAVFLGNSARVADSLWTIVSMILVLGLFIGRSWAYRSTVAFYLFSIADLAVDLTPNARAKYHVLMLQHHPSEADPLRRLSWLIFSLIAFELVPLSIFLAGRTSYIAWCEKRRLSDGVAPS